MPRPDLWRFTYMCEYVQRVRVPVYVVAVCTRRLTERELDEHQVVGLSRGRVNTGGFHRTRQGQIH